MKKILTLFLSVVLLALTSFADAQDSLMYKIKYEKFKSWQRTGRALTISGLALGVVGTGLLIWGTGDSPSAVNQDWSVIAGSICTGAGVVALIPGAIYWGIGNSKTREYKLRLENLGTGFYYKPNSTYAPGSAGFVLTYRF